MWGILSHLAKSTIGLKKLVLIAPCGFLESELVELITASPTLEELDITDFSVSIRFFEALGKACPKLKSFRLNRRLLTYEGWDYESEDSKNKEATEIAKHLPYISELQLLGHPMTSKGLEVILDGCLCLRILNLEDCYDIFYGQSLEAKLDSIGIVRLPYRKGRRSSSSEAGDRNKSWTDLPPDAVLNIFEKVGSVEVLLSGQAVSRGWRHIARHPRLWKRINLSLQPDNHADRISEMLIRETVYRGTGQIEDFRLEGYIWDATLADVATSSTVLKRITLVSPWGFTGKSLYGLICNCPLLEELELIDYTFPMPEDMQENSEFWISWEAYADIGRACPKLKHLRLNRRNVVHEGWYSNSDVIRNREAVEIARSMPQLRSLELAGNPLTNIGLIAILKECSTLQSINIEGCYNVTRSQGVERLLSSKMVTPRRSESVSNYDAAFARNAVRFLPRVPPWDRSYRYLYG